MRIKFKCISTKLINNCYIRVELVKTTDNPFTASGTINIDTNVPIGDDIKYVVGNLYNIEITESI